MSATLDKLHQAKRRKLIRNLSLVNFGVTGVYILLDWLLQIHVQYFIYIMFLACGAATYVLIRVGADRLAKFIGLLSFNVIIFLVASSEHRDTGMFFHFMAAGTTALVLFGYEERGRAIFFAVLSSILMLLTLLGNIQLMEFRDFAPEHARIFFMINILVSSIVSVYAFLLFAKLNRDTERELQANEAIVTQQNADLKMANSQLDGFVYSVSHDLRSPLSSMGGLVQLASMTNDMDEVRHYLSMMKGRIKSMDAFIQDLISHARNVQADIKKEQVQLKKLVDEITENVSFSPDAENVVINNTIDDEFALQTDRVRIKTIISNLVSNALRYKDTGKENPFVAIRCDVAADGCLIEVEDNGLGIGSEHLPNLFKMFYRAHHQNTGSGLGLYMVKENTEKLGGRISVVSQPGVGSIFRVSLPV
jgi:signal transduction histidine kinase